MGIFMIESRILAKPPFSTSIKSTKCISQILKWLTFSELFFNRLKDDSAYTLETAFIFSEMGKIKVMCYLDVNTDLENGDELELHWEKDGIIINFRLEIKLIVSN